MRVALLAILALVAVLVCHVHAAELAIESHLSPREQQQLLEAETDPAQAARREQLLQDWGAFIMMSLHAQKAGMEMGANVAAGDGPEFPSYTVPRSIQDANANADANPSANKPKGSMVNNDMALRPPNKDGSVNQFPKVMGNDNKGEYPETGGYHPPQGYFVQTPTCDAAMRLWFNKCAFLDAPNSMFWKNSLNHFPPLDAAETSANFLGNLLANQAAEQYLGENSNVKQGLRLRNDMKPQGAEGIGGGGGGEGGGGGGEGGGGGGEGGAGGGGEGGEGQ